MPTFYSDIKRYNLNKAFLQRIARLVIHYLGWDIKQENGNGFITKISNVKDLTCIECTIKIHRGYIALNCESNPELPPLSNFNTLSQVKQFILAMDKHLESIPQYQVQSQKETIGHYK
jgi:hypothetical protein